MRMMGQYQSVQVLFRCMKGKAHSFICIYALRKGVHCPKKVISKPCGAPHEPKRPTSGPPHRDPPLGPCLPDTQGSAAKDTAQGRAPSSSLYATALNPKLHRTNAKAPAGGPYPSQQPKGRSPHTYHSL